MYKIRGIRLVILFFSINVSLMLFQYGCSQDGFNSKIENNIDKRIENHLNNIFAKDSLSYLMEGVTWHIEKIDSLQYISNSIYKATTLNIAPRYFFYLLVSRDTLILLNNFLNNDNHLTLKITNCIQFRTNLSVTKKLYFIDKILETVYSGYTPNILNEENNIPGLSLSQQQEINSHNIVEPKISESINKIEINLFVWGKFGGFLDSVNILITPTIIKISTSNLANKIGDWEFLQ